ncbi:MAG: putative manganese-dependent inorganic diphosphatase [Bacilli bacterium]|nr:putative manganese-dependent inorganic diphosphatase [Bacilli bacterium]
MKTYIFGHKKPDTDSVMSSIALSYLENHSNNNTEARVLGDINKESIYALKYFKVKAPKYLNDVKLQLKDIDYHKNLFLNEKASIYDGYELMLKKNITGIPIVKEDNTYRGLITIKDTTRNIIRDDLDTLYTSYDNILNVCKGKEILRFDDEIKGRLLVASYRSTTFLNNIKLNEDMILMVGDRHSIIEYAVESGVKLVILTGGSIIKDKHLEIAKKNHVNIIETDMDTYHMSRVITLSNYLKTILSNFNQVTFLDTDFVDDIKDVNSKLHHTNYPVVNKQGKCLGLLKITDLTNTNPKKVILVDHNEPLQSADGIEEAEIIEIIDHHNLGSITTKSPINVRNMAVGSTCTIITLLFEERKVEIPKSIAGVLLSGILSDTLILRSPTATRFDKDAVEKLSSIAEVDYVDYGMKLLKAGTSLDGMEPADVLFNDYKIYTINDKSFSIGQFFTMNFQDIEKDINKYIETLNQTAEANHYEMVCLYVTDIIKNGSYVLFNEKAKNYIEVLYGIENPKEGLFIEGCISRKKNIVPLVMNIFDN